MRILRTAACLGVALFSLAVVSAGCRAAVATAPAAEAPRPKPRTAHLVATGIVHGKVGTLVYVDRLRDRPAALKIVNAGYLAEVFDGAGLDPMRDLDRMFIAFTGITSEDRAVVIAQHKLSPDQLRAAVDALVAKSEPPGEWLKNLGMPAARVTVRGHTRVVALIDDEYVAVLPEPLAGEARKLLGTGGFPDPEGDESVSTIARDPAQSLRAPRVPRIPETISEARVTLRFGKDGSVDASVVGQSSSEQQAEQDARMMQDEVARATSVKVSIFRVQFFKQVPFRAEGKEVKSDLHLSADEVDKLLGMAELMRRHL